MNYFSKVRLFLNKTSIFRLVVILTPAAGRRCRSPFYFLTSEPGAFSPVGARALGEKAHLLQSARAASVQTNSGGAEGIKTRKKQKRKPEWTEPKLSDPVVTRTRASGAELPPDRAGRVRTSTLTHRRCDCSVGEDEEEQPEQTGQWEQAFIVFYFYFFIFKNSAGPSSSLPSTVGTDRFWSGPASAINIHAAQQKQSSDF